ncbi:MAG: serine hydrolase domain-containing protein [Gemmatales bacterium]
MMKAFSYGCMALLLMTSSLSAQSAEHKLSAAQIAQVDAAVKKEMEKQGLVGVAVGVLQQGEVVYLQGYGLADREKKTPVTTKSVFNWASNSKPLCGVAAMQLVEKGQLNLDVDVRQYVPEFPKKEHIITMRQLLCHQSGIQHYGKVIPTERAYATKLPYLDPVLALDVFNRTPLIYQPGEKTVYSSYAYILASAVVQRAGKAPLGQQIEKRITGPLGMTSMQLDMEFDHQPNWTVGYTKEAGQVVRAKEEAHYWKHGAGGYKSNIGDFAKWAQALLNHRLVSPAIEKQMWTRQKTNDGKLAGYGLGFAIEDQNGLKVSHNGKQDETTTRLVIYPEKKHGIVVMTNCGYGDPAAISTAIYQALK